MDYVIRFQNTGSANATFVRIEDNLDEDLDWRCNESRSAYSAWLDSEYQKIEELSEHLKNIGKAIPTIYENASPQRRSVSERETHSQIPNTCRTLLS